MKSHILPLSLALLCASCSGSEFATSTAPAVADATPVPPPAAADAVAQPPAVGTPLAEEFDVELGTNPVDMVWVIDNSGSMAKEAEQVRLNFTHFIDSLGTKVDARVALISKRTPDSAIGSSTHVALSAAQLSAGHIQIDADVGSNNPLAILASSICGATATDVVPGAGQNKIPAGRMKICNTLTDPDLTADSFTRQLENPLLVKQVRGSLLKFFRPGAKKIFVVVTDDKATFVNDKNFLPLIRPSLPTSAGDPVLFAFRGTDSSPVPSCSITNEGKQYEALATATKGAVFDLCEPDWSANFEKLRDGVGRIASTEFLIKDPAFKQVVAVYIDGVKLTADEFTVTGAKVVVKSDVVQGSSKRITVQYIH